MQKKSRVAGVLVAAVSTVVALAAPAQAAAPKATVVYSSSTYISNDVDVHGDHLAVLSCATVRQVLADGTAGALPWGGCGGHVETEAGVAYSRDGALLAHTVTLHTPDVNPEIQSRVDIDAADGDEHGSVYVSDYEYASNPDAAARYGPDSTSSCVTAAVGAPYRGRLDSGLPAVAAGPAQSWYVADRDANTIYRINAAGKLSVLAVIAPVKVKVSAALAAAKGWPACVVGTTIAFEAQPTEIEVGPDGTVYVAAEPGSRYGLHSRIYAINPKTGSVRRLPQHYAGSVDLAVGAEGQLFVSRPAADRIMVIERGRSQTYLELSQVGAVEADRGTLYAVRGRSSSDARNASVVRIG